MKFTLARVLVLALAADTAVAASWFTSTPYNKWHETELERWLSDHDIPYPTASDRKNLENLVKDNWQSAFTSPYANWDTGRLQKYLQQQGTEVKKGAENNKDALVAQVKSVWQDADSEAHSTYSDVKDWIFNSWTESSLKAYCDRHGIPVPQPRSRDSMIAAARDNYQSAADKANEVAAYPGNWLYESWSDSDLKAWLDERGIPAPQNGNRDKLIASVRRNSYQARKSIGDYYTSATDAAKGYAAHGAHHGSTAVTSIATTGSAYARDAAASGSSYANDVASSGSSYANNVASSGSAYARDVASSGSSYARDVASSGSVYARDVASSGSSYARVAASSLSSGGQAAASSLSSGGHAAASSASSLAKSGGAKIASSVSSFVANSGASATDAVKAAGESINAAVFDTWSDSQLKAWADKNGIKVPQGSKRNEVLAIARKNIAKLTGDNVSASAASAYGAATSSAGNQYAAATGYAADQASGLAGQVYNGLYHYYTEAKIAVGLQTNYLSSASATVSSAYGKASSAVKGEL